VSDGADHRIERLNIQLGKRMVIYFEINARNYEGRWYNSIRAFDAKEIVPTGNYTTNGQTRA
jgi:hypothetical protein